MKQLDFNIAGYIIRFESAAEGPELLPSERFRNFMVPGGNHDLLITVHPGDLIMPPDAIMVFNAPYVEETNGLRLKKNDEFWSVFKDRDDLYIKTIFPNNEENKQAVLRFSLAASNWDLWINGPGSDTDPMEYPLDGLLLYYLTVVSGDIMIHASGVNYSGKGYLFSGISGRGKSTMAKLWDKHGARVIHDDRLILRREGRGCSMFNTPVYNNEKPCESWLDRIFIIEHGTENKIVPVSGAECVSLIMANCIQHNWTPDIIARLLESVSALADNIPAARLYFKPDHGVIDLILENE